MKKLFSILLAICLIAGLLPVVASAAGVVKVSIVSDAKAGTMTDYTLTEGTTIYLVTNDAGAASTAGATADNYKIKLDYPAGGVATVYLNGANLKCINTPLVITGASGAEDNMLVVEADSTLESGAKAALRATTTNLTITGEGKLTIHAKKGHGIQVYHPAATDENKQTVHSLIFDEANVEVNADNSEGGWGVGIGDKAKNITVSGGNVVVNTVGKVAGMYSMNGDLLITGGANVEVNVEDQVGLSAFTSIVQESGHLQIRTAGTSAPGISGCKDIRIVGGTVDIKGPAAAYGTINLDEYEGEYTAVVSQAQDGSEPTPYNPEDHNLGYYLIFKLTLGASYEVNIKNGKADKTVVAEGDTVTITARVAPAGKVFEKWEVNEGNVTLADPTASETTFAMPAENVKITAKYKDIEAEGGQDDPVDDPVDDPADDPVDDPVDTPNNDNTDNTTDNNDDTTNKPDDNKGDNKQPATKGNGSGITALLLVLIIVVSVGIGGAAVILFIKIKAQKAKAVEEPAEETVEDAE